VGIQAFCPEGAIDGFCERVVVRLIRPREVDLHSILINESRAEQNQARVAEGE
jgi:hypothetical protein